MTINLKSRLTTEVHGPLWTKKEVLVTWLRKLKNLSSGRWCFQVRAEIGGNIATSARVDDCIQLYRQQCSPSINEAYYVDGYLKITWNYSCYRLISANTESMLLPQEVIITPRLIQQLRRFSNSTGISRQGLGSIRCALLATLGEVAMPVPPRT